MANQPKKYKKFVATAATATLVASAIVPVASAASLSDIKGNTHEEAITSLVDAGVINGYPDGTFQPNKTLTRSDVVKLLGKYLVSKGLEVPADYKTNVRFNDLTSASNDELLKYAAVVYDAGVFSGSNGNLLAGDNITRENMAVVLVRAFDTLNNIDLVSYVQGQEYKKDVKDLFTAKAEARAAIEVLDFFDITNPSVANFNPKGSTTRGQFATFLYKTINTDFSAVTGVANSAVSEIKAINNTTVEVTFKETVENIEALDFTIDGLEVKNAVVKQTDSKTVVLTTAAQTGEKVYTLNVNAAKAGTFKGISAVIPTAIDLVEKSQQGVLGQQVTVKAKVTVAQGQSAAGIPVTFNIPGQGTLTQAVVAEAVTNAEGVATYTYTRYANITDDVVAYATGDRTKYSAGKVYWSAAQQLTIKDVTGVNSLSNNDSKVYEINSANNANKYVFVTFKENLNVTADKVVRTVGAKGSSTYVLNQNNTISGVASDYPYEITTGAKAVIAVKLDSNGKANLVLAGANATVTPVVYEGVAVDSNDAGTIAGDQLNEFTNASYNATALQAAAPSVSFEAKHALGLTIQAAGVPNAATYKSKTETGGRDYTVTYVDKDGKPAAANTVVQVAIPVQTASNGVFLIDADGNQVAGTTQGEYRVFNVTVKGTEGKAKFTVGSTSVTQYVEPIAFIDNGTGIGKKAGLDATDLQAKGEATHFTDAVTYSTSLTLVDANEKEIKSVYTGEAAYFLYETVDQNGKPRAYRLADGTAAATTLTYSVTAGTSPLVVQGKTIAAGDSATFNEVVSAGSNKGRLVVNANAGTTASVYATATVAGLVLGTTETVTAQFTATSTSNVNGTVDAVNKTTNVVTINGVPYSLSGATYLNQGNVVPTLAAFYDHLTVGKEVSVTKDTAGNLVFNVKGQSPVTGSTLVDNVNAALASASNTQLHNALLANNDYKALPAAQQATVRTAVNGGSGLDGEYVNVAEFEADLNPALVAAYQVLFGNVITAANTGATDAIKLTNTVTALEVLPNTATTVTALKGITNSTTLAAVLADIAGLTNTNYDTTAKLLKAINDSIATHKAGESAASINAALAAVVAELTAGTLVYADVITELEDNASTLTLSLTAFNALTAAEKEDVIDELLAQHNATAFTPSTFKTVFNKAVVAVKDTVEPKVTAAKYDAGTNKLTLTFSEAVDSTLTAGSIQFTDVDGLPGTVAFTAVAKSDTTTLELTLTTPPATFVVGADIVDITLTTGTVVDKAIPTANSLVINYASTPIDVK